MEFNEKLFYTVSTNHNIRHSVSVIKFPGGEVNVNINSGALRYDDPEVDAVHEVILEARITSMDDLMAMFLATDAIRRVYADAKVSLFMPYFPFARQDRVCNSGEALSISVVALLINAQGYHSVLVVDPHSPVGPAVLDRCIVWDQFDVFKDIKDDWGNWTIVAPDQGALKKTEDFAKRVGAAGVISCTKNRELSTGKITGMYVNGPGDMSHLNLLVLDDICDGGRTFIELAALVAHSKPKAIELAVTHGIFSKGVGIVADHFDMIHTTNSLPQIEHSKLNVFEL